MFNFAKNIHKLKNLQTVFEKGTIRHSVPPKVQYSSYYGKLKMCQFTTPIRGLYTFSLVWVLRTDI